MMHTDDRLVGILDLGTNSTMLSIGLIQDQRPNLLTEFFKVTRLGEDVRLTGTLKETAVARTLEAALEMTEKARKMGVREFYATATSAVRDASNGTAFLDRAQDLLGYRPMILSGPEEAALVFIGSTADLTPGEKVITADPGGGSTEVNLGFVGEAPQWGHSFNVGCVRQGEAFDLFETFNFTQTAQAQASISDAFQPAFERPEKADAKQLLISGGTATTFAAMMLELADYDAEKVHLAEFSLQDLDYWIDRLSQMPSSQRRQIPGLKDGREAVLPTGLIIMRSLLLGFGFERFSVTTRALRYGLLIKVATSTI